MVSAVVIRSQMGELFKPIILTRAKKLGPFGSHYLLDCLSCNDSNGNAMCFIPLVVLIIKNLELLASLGGSLFYLPGSLVEESFNIVSTVLRGLMQLVVSKIYYIDRKHVLCLGTLSRTRNKSIEMVFCLGGW